MKARKKIEGVGAVIREFRLQSGLSQNALADRMDVDGSFVSRLENGGRYPSIEMILRLAVAMQVSPGDIMNKIAEGYTPSDACFPWGEK